MTRSSIRSSTEIRSIDLLDGDWYANGPYDDYAWMRRHSPSTGTGSTGLPLRGRGGDRFIPRAVSAWEPVIRDKVTSLLDAVRARGASSEVMADMAAPLPAMMIGRLLGFPEDRWPDLQR